MGALSKFLGKPKEIDVDGEKVIIYPLKVKDMEVFSKQNPTEEEIKLIGKQILKLSIPDATDEEIENLNMKAFIKITDEIAELNGFKDEHLGLIKAKIAQQEKQQ